MGTVAPLGIRRVEAIHYYVRDLERSRACLRGRDLAAKISQEGAEHLSVFTHVIDDQHLQPAARGEAADSRWSMARRTLGFRSGQRNGKAKTTALAEVRIKLQLAALR